MTSGPGGSVAGMRHLTADDVHRMLPPATAIEVARRTAITTAEGAVHAAERIWHRPPGMPGTIGVMPAHLADDGTDPAIFTTKIVGVFPGATPAVGGLIAVQDATTGAPLATIDAAAVTAVRTAAHSGLSIDLVSRPDAATVAILGAGVQGWAHLQAAMAVRPVTAVRVWNRTPAAAEAFADRARSLPGIDHVRVCATPTAAARRADIVCLCTNSPTPLIKAADLRAGSHVTAIGAFTPDTRELAADVLAAARAIVVDDRAAAAHEAGDVLLAIAEGAITPDAVTADLAELVTATTAAAPTHNPPTQGITVYKSVGTSAMDAVAVRSLLAATADRHLAVYGTLAPGQPHHHILAPHPGTWTTGTIAGIRLADGWKGYPGVHLTGDARVPVHLCTTEGDIDWAALDTFEGPGYRRRRVVVHDEEGTAIVATMYGLAHHVLAQRA